jgi:hypothetical protein
VNLRFIGGLGASSKIPQGGREMWEVFATGPVSYSVATGDPVSGPSAGEHMSSPSGEVLTVSGNYSVIFQPKATNTLRPLWVARWRFSGVGGSSGVASITVGGDPTGMTPGTFPLEFTGGGGSGAAGTITVTATAVTNITITSPGTGYTSAPTVTAATGGTPPTLTAQLGFAGQEVGSGANLSAESIQFFAAGGDY